ncbi:unnamed protein product, partial [Ilex paraguariensis]
PPTDTTLPPTEPPSTPPVPLTTTRAQLNEDSPKPPSSPTPNSSTPRPSSIKAAPPPQAASYAWPTIRTLTCFACCLIVATSSTKRASTRG